MLSIVYASSAVRLLDRVDLVHILKKSQEANLQYQITGMLLYKGGNFIQVIEGHDEDVKQLYKNIELDPRHKDVTLLSQDPIKERQFPDWSMGFRNLDRLSKEEIDGYSKFLEDDFSPEFFKTQPTRAYILLLSFKETM